MLIFLSSKQTQHTKWIDCNTFANSVCNFKMRYYSACHIFQSMRVPVTLCFLIENSNWIKSKWGWILIYVDDKLVLLLTLEKLDVTVNSLKSFNSCHWFSSHVYVWQTTQVLESLVLFKLFSQSMFNLRQNITYGGKEFKD